MVEGFCIEYLADYPEYINVCAAWNYGHWGVHMKGRTFESSLKTFCNCARKGSIPFSFIAIDKKKNIPVAMGALWEESGHLWKDLTPWVSAIYTHPNYRGLGLGKAIVKRIEEEARYLEVEQIYLFSGIVTGFYKKIGYEEIETIKDDWGEAGTLTLLTKRLEI